MVGECADTKQTTPTHRQSNVSPSTLLQFQENDRFLPRQQHVATAANQQQPIAAPHAVQQRLGD